MNWRLTLFLLVFLASVDSGWAAEGTGNLMVHDLIPDLFSFLRIAPEEEAGRNVVARSSL